MRENTVGLKTLVLAMLLLPVQPAAGQDFYAGTVVDAATKQGLASVLVQLKGTPTQTQTDSQGKFIINTSSSILVIEAETMTLTNGYIVDPNNSGYIMTDPNGSGGGTAATVFTGATGSYRVTVSYVPENDGNPELTLSVGATVAGQHTYPSGDGYFALNTILEWTLNDVFITNGQVIKIEGAADSEAYARVDRIVLEKSSPVGEPGLIVRPGNHPLLTAVFNGKHLQISWEGVDFSEIKVFGIDGRLLAMEAGRQVSPYPVPELTDGMYLVSLKIGSTVFPGRLVVAGSCRGIHFPAVTGNRTAEGTGTAAKAAANDVLTFYKTGYDTKEISVTAGDTDLVVELSRPSSSWPNVSTTGWQHTGVTLQPLSGGTVRLDQPGQVMDSRDIDGCVVILANNVTLKRSRVRCGSDAAAVLVNWGYAGLSGILIEDCEINGLGVGQFGVSGSGVTIRRCDISNGTDGIMFNTGDVFIEDNFVHDLASPPGSHNDGLQTEGCRDVVIRHNNIEVAYPQTGCISLWGATDNILVENNLLNGGGWSTYAGDQGTNIRFLNNHFGRKFYPNCGYWGPVTSWNASGAGNQWTGNVWDDTGLPVNP